MGESLSNLTRAQNTQKRLQAIPRGSHEAHYPVRKWPSLSRRSISTASHAYSSSFVFLLLRFSFLLETGTSVALK